MNFSRDLNNVDISIRIKLKELSESFNYFFLFKNDENSELMFLFVDSPLSLKEIYKPNSSNNSSSTNRIYHKVKPEHLNHISIPYKKIRNIDSVVQKSYESYHLHSIRTDIPTFCILDSLPVITLLEHVPTRIISKMRNEGYIQAKISINSSEKLEKIKFENIFEGEVNIVRITFENQVAAYVKYHSDVDILVKEESVFSTMINFIEEKYKVKSELNIVDENEKIDSLFDSEFVAYVAKSKGFKISNF